MDRAFTTLATLSDLEQRLRARPDAERLAVAYAEAAARTRRRPMRTDACYRYPRGRITDVIPYSPALAGLPS